MTTYYEGTLSGSDTTPANTLRLAIKNAFTTGAPTGWSIVEDYANAANKLLVLKCSAAATAGADFYVIFAHVLAGTGNLYVFVSEEYNATTHIMNKGVPTGGSAMTVNSFTTAADGTTPVALPFTAAITTPVYPYRDSYLDLTSPNAWSLFVWDDALVISFKGSNVGSFYCGNFTSLVKTPATNDPVTICLLGFGNAYRTGSWSSPAGATRSAMNFSSNNIHTFTLRTWHSNANASTGATPFNSSIINSSSWDKYNVNSGGYFEPYLLLRGSNDTVVSDGLAGGVVRGKLDRVVNSGTGNWGDTFTVDGITYQAHAPGKWSIKG